MLGEEGAAVAAVVRTEEEAGRLTLSNGGDGSVSAVDIADEDSVRACFDEIQDRYGRVDGLVHTVGMWERRPFVETPLEAWESVLRVNLTTTFLCFREAVRVMDGRGTLIAFASRLGADGGTIGQAAYAAAKAGVIRLVESVDAEFEGVTAHAIAPSTILYGEGGEGVSAEALVELTRDLLTGMSTASGGAVIRAYGAA